MESFEINEQTRLVIVGCGKMGEAIVGGLLHAGLFSPSSIIAVAPRSERREYLEEEYRIVTVSSVVELASFDITERDICIIAVKPQVIFDVIPELRVAVRNPLFVSIAAGVTIEALSEALGEKARVARVMPNTPALVRAGCSVISLGDLCTQAESIAIERVFSSFGKAVVVDEKHQNAAAALSGCGPAYFALIINAMIRAGVEQGLSRDLAEMLSVQTMKGTAKMLRKLDIHPEQLIDMVTSPGGTTIAGLRELEKGGLREAFASAVEAASWRAEELAFENDEDEE